MQTQFQYITDLAKQYRHFSEQPTALYKAVNDLPQNVVEDILKEYGSTENDFKPVNLLRAEVARQLLEGITIDEQVVEIIKDKIREKDISYFSSYSEEFINGLKNYKETKGKGDYFTAWNLPWRFFFVYFHRGSVK